MRRKYLVRVRKTEDWKHPEVLGKFDTIKEAKHFADMYETKLETKPYKREFCSYGVENGVYLLGYEFTTF